MARAFDVSYIPTSQTNTAGGGLDQQYWERPNPTSIDQIYGLSDFSWPHVVLETAVVPPVEGADAPFRLRFDTAKEPLYAAWRKRQQLIAQALRESTWGLGTPTPILDAPPDETPITVGKMLHYPAEAILARRKAALSVAANARQDAPGAWIEIIPASEYTFPVCQLLSEIQEHLLEDVNGGASFSSGIWTVAEVLAYLNHRISRFLLETGIMQVRTTQAAAAATEFYDLPTDLIDLRRVAWTVGSNTTVLPRADAFTADMNDQTWETSTSTPQMHMLVPEKSLELRTVPRASADGTLDLIYVRNFPPVTNDCTPLPIPDEWVPFVKWGVISDMLSKEGEGNDPQRARYAEQRWEEGIQLARLYLGTNQ